MAKRLIPKIPELGRWDDLFAYDDILLQEKAMQFYANVLQEGVEAKEILKNIDHMSEEQCQNLLNKYS